MSESETVAKNRIEFQWGSKLQGTSSEALGTYTRTILPRSLVSFLYGAIKKKNTVTFDLLYSKI